MVHIRELEEYAKENNVPIMMKDGIEFLTQYIKENNVKKVTRVDLEIGEVSLVIPSYFQDFLIKDYLYLKFIV